MKKLLAVMGIIGVLGLALVPAATALAQGPPAPAESCKVSDYVSETYNDTCGNCAGGEWIGGTPLEGCEPVCCVLTTVHNVGTWFFWVVLMIAFIMLLWGAIQFMTAGGSEDKTAAARQTLIYALIGVAVAYFSRLMIRMVSNILT